MLYALYQSAADLMLPMRLWSAVAGQGFALGGTASAERWRVATALCEMLSRAALSHRRRAFGIDHVGVGTDFDGGGGIKGFNDHSEALNVTVELVKRGYSEDQIAKIWGGNLLRVWREVEKGRK